MNHLAGRTTWGL